MKQRGKSPKGKDDKRASRFHQMEQMEAAARGTAPTMTLDTTGILASTSFERNMMVADDFLLGQDRGGPSYPVGSVGALGRTTSTSTSTRTSENFFSQRDKYEVDQTVNLMDASSVRYSHEGQGGGGGGRRTSFVDIFIGGSGSTSGSVGIGSRGSVKTSWSSSTTGKIIVGCFLLIFVALLTLSVPYLMTENNGNGSAAGNSFNVVDNVGDISVGQEGRDVNRDEGNPGPQTEATYDSKVDNDGRFKALKTALLGEKATNSDRLADDKSSAFQALRWLTDDDPAKISPDDPALLPRFALATLFYDTQPSSKTNAITSERQVMDEAQATSTTDLDGSSGWERDDYWMSDANVCDWYGVGCDNGKVVRLNMTSNRLSGTIPLELKSLTDMMLLDLSKNELSGSIPVQVCFLSQIKYFLLQQNALTGSIPSEIEKMAGVFELYLSQNQLSDSIPSSIGRLNNLRALHLDFNKLTGGIPDLSGLKDINYLRLNDNSLQGALPFSISKLTMLYNLQLQNNRLTGTIPPEMAASKRLRLLYLANNVLTGKIPDIFDEISTLTDLQLHGNSLKSELPTSMGYLTSLRRLTVEGNVVTGTLPSSWGGMTDLEALDLYHNELVGPIPSEFGKMTNLRNLGLKHNFLQGEIPSEIGNLSHLTTLDLSHNAIRGTVPQEFGQLENLVNLDLADTLLTGIMPTEVCSLSDHHQLKTLEADCQDEIECSCCTRCN